MISTIREELGRLNQIDTVKLADQAKMLMEVDDLINKDKLEEAKELLLESGGKITKSGKKRSSRSKSSKTSYSSDLSKKIAFKINAAKEAAENATTNAKAQKVAAEISQTATIIAAKGD